LALEIADTECLPIAGGPIELSWSNGRVFAIGACDRSEYQGAIFGGACDGAEFVHGPAQSHGAGTRHKAEGGTQACRSATSGGRCDGAECLRSDGEGDAARSNGTG